MTRTLSAIGLSALTSTLTASAFLLALNDYREAVSWREHTLIVIHALDGVLTGVQTASTSRGTYLLTEDPKALAPYLDACKHALQRLQEVQDLTVDNPSQQERAERLGELVRAKVLEMDSTLKVAKDGQHSRAVSMFRQGNGAILMTDVRAVVEEMKDEEERLLTERGERARDSVRWVTAVTLLGNGLAALFAVLAAVWAGRATFSD
jgi:methyl-accepting chemotaxis protein